MNLRFTSTAVLSFATAGAAFAQNDDCSGAIAASAGVATAFDTTAATTSAEPWPCALGGTDIWFSYTPTMSGGSVNLDLCGSSYDTAIEAFSGTCGALTSIACNDDSCGLQSNMNFGPTNAGTTLYFRIGGFNGASGTGTFTLTENPPGMGDDECTGAAPIMSGVATPFDTSAATQSPTAWPCAGGGGPDIWFSYTTTMANSAITADLCGTSYDCAVEIFSGTCAALVSETCNDDSCGLQSQATALSPGAAGTVFYIRVGGFAGSTGPGTITVTEGPNPCDLPDDQFEENDSCQAGSTIAAGFYSGLFASTVDADFYEIVIPPDEILDVFLTDTVNEDLDLNLYDSNCNLIQAFNTDGLSWPGGSSGTTVIVEVFLDPFFSGIGCLNYDMDIQLTPDPCAALGDDSFEDNDDCNSAAPIGDGNYMGLTSNIADQDMYSLSVSDGGTLTVDMFFLHSDADLDIYLWDPSIACDSDVVGEGTGTGALVVGFSASDNEQIVYTNNTGASQNLILEVTVYNFSAGNCASYDLDIMGADGDGGIGTNYCTANPNSAGTTGVMSAMGSRSVANNDVTITASDLPQNSFGFFICSETPGFVPNPAGSEGNLCLGGAIGRYVGPGQIQNTGGSGDFSISLDLPNTPQPNGFVSVMAGERWHYQAWHRDSVGGMATSNFSDALHIDFI